MTDGLKHLVFHIRPCKPLVFHVSESRFSVRLKSRQCSRVCDLAEDVAVCLPWCQSAALAVPELPAVLYCSSTLGTEPRVRPHLGFAATHRSRWSQSFTVQHNEQNRWTWKNVVVSPPGGFCRSPPSLLKGASAKTKITKIKNWPILSSVLFSVGKDVSLAVLCSFRFTWHSFFLLLVDWHTISHFLSLVVTNLSFSPLYS